MKFIITQRIAINAETYSRVGRVLDEVNMAVKNVLPECDHADFVAFETRPCKAAKFDEVTFGQAEMPLQEGSGY